MSVEGVRPSFGRLTGGTVVTFAGSGLRWEGMGELRCRFGSRVSGVARATSSSMVQCATPEATDGGRVVVGMEADGQQV